MSGYSPAPEYLYVPNTYGQAVVASLGHAWRNPPYTIGEFGPWLDRAIDTLAEFRKTTGNYDLALEMLAQALQMANPLWDIETCKRKLQGDLS